MKKKIAKCKNTTTGEHLWDDLVINRGFFFTEVAANAEQCVACKLVRLNN